MCLPDSGPVGIHLYRCVTILLGRACARGAALRWEYSVSSGSSAMGNPQVILARLRAEAFVNPIGGIAASKPDYQPPIPASVR